MVEDIRLLVEGRVNCLWFDCLIFPVRNLQGFLTGLIDLM